MRHYDGAMIQTSCSELLVDTRIHDPAQALETFQKLFRDLKWSSSPPLTLKVLEVMKERVDAACPIEVLVFDGKGNSCYLEYGDNGYIDSLGYRFDSGCSDYDERCYPIFREAIERLNGQLITCDGGHNDGYYDWEAKNDRS